MTVSWLTNTHDIAFDGGGRPEPHPRYETPPGRQLQFDWKEDLRMTSRRGEAFEFNVFSATLGCSRMHRFVYSKGRTRDELLSCVFDTIFIARMSKIVFH